MIYSYGLKNYFGFKEGAEVSFYLNNKVPKAISRGSDCAKIIGVKGANGSGKTNLLKALGFLSKFCTESFKNKDYEEIDADCYFKNRKPCEFYIDFVTEKYRYFYELGVTEEEVIYERLYRKVSNEDEGYKRTRKVLVLERKKNEVVKRIDELSSIDVIVLKNNSSIISTAYNYKFSEPLWILNDVYVFFLNMYTNVTYVGLKDVEFNSPNVSVISEQYLKNEDAFDFIKKMIIESDLGICNVKILDRLDELGKKIYFPVFYHEVDGDEFSLTIYDESSGTQSLYIKLYLYWLAIKYGGVLVLDEFDLNFHPDFLPKLLDVFEDEKINKNNAQFIFTSHITEVMDKLGKYRTYLVNKKNNESFCYRLDEIKGDLLRNGRLISPIYKEGKLGGVPKL